MLLALIFAFEKIALSLLVITWNIFHSTDFSCSHNCSRQFFKSYHIFALLTVLFALILLFNAAQSARILSVSQITAQMTLHQPEGGRRITEPGPDTCQYLSS